MTDLPCPCLWLWQIIAVQIPGLGMQMAPPLGPGTPCCFTTHWCCPQMPAYLTRYCRGQQVTLVQLYLCLFSWKGHNRQVIHNLNNCQVSAIKPYFNLHYYSGVANYFTTYGIRQHEGWPSLLSAAHPETRMRVRTKSPERLSSSNPSFDCSW